MKVKILETDDRLGIKKGEVYEAERYKYDPQEKVSLLSRVADGHNPMCNQYLSSVAFWMQNRWMVIEDGRYVPEKGE